MCRFIMREFGGTSLKKFRFAFKKFMTCHIEEKNLQRVRFWIEKFTTCQTLYQKIEVSDAELKYVRRVRFLTIFFLRNLGFSKKKHVLIPFAQSKGQKCSLWAFSWCTILSINFFWIRFWFKRLRVRFWIKIFQRVRFSIKFVTTCQIFNWNV